MKQRAVLSLCKSIQTGCSLSPEIMERDKCLRNGRIIELADYIVCISWQIRPTGIGKQQGEDFDFSHVIEIFR